MGSEHVTITALQAQHHWDRTRQDRPVSIGSTEFTARNFRNIRTRVSGQEGPRFYFTLVLSEVFIHRNLGSIHILYTLRMSDISFCLIADIPNM